MVGIPDEALLAGFVSGDPDATRAFLQRFRGRVYGLAVAMLHDRAVAEDVAQEVFVRAWRHGPSYDPRLGTVSNWLLRITRNLALDRLRRRRKEIEIIDPDILESLVTSTRPSAVEDAAITSDMAAAVTAALAQVPPEQRRALILAAYYGRTAEEISASEGIPLGTAKTRILLGLRKVRALLDTAGEEP
ncbi:MAG TPA: sigma-70 family RNA polymerase sigma factor [Acidimicrobiia bacterium]|nr:sigma-70 family RNA polymerase sigma factor [Acidimicrobiia bacterium]